MNTCSITRLCRAASLIAIVIICATLSCSNPVEPEKPVEYFIYVGNGSPENKIYKIDATTDDIVDSLAIEGVASQFTCSPDGRKLWLVGPELTLIVGTSDFVVERKLTDLGFFRPIFIPRSKEVFCAGTDRVFFLDSDYCISYQDSSVGLYNYPDLLIDEESQTVAGKDLRGRTHGSGNRYYFYDFVQRKLVDSIDIVDAIGAPREGWVTHSPDHTQLYGSGFGPIEVYSRISGKEVANHPSECEHNTAEIYFVNSFSEFILTTPHDSRFGPKCEVITKYDAATFVKTGEIALIDYWTVDSIHWIVHGTGASVDIPGLNKVYVCGNSMEFHEPLLVLGLEPFHVRKILFSGTGQGFSCLAIGRKP